MDPKVLLMPVYSRGNEIERLSGALSLACLFNAHLDVLHAQAKPSNLLDNELLALSADVRQRVISIMDNDALHEQKDLQSHFSELCERYGVVISKHAQDDKPTACYREIEGARSELVALQGRVSDLVIIPRPKTGVPTQTFEEAILHTGRPVLLVPRGMREFKLRKALIGWDGGLEVSRAVQQSLPFLVRAEAVTIATSQDKVDEKPGGRDLAHYLGCHGVEAEVKMLNAKAHSAGEALLEMAADLGGDLLVTGGYAHTRLRQRILGGVTQHMLQHAEVPVLMAH